MMTNPVQAVSDAMATLTTTDGNAPPQSPQTNGQVKKEKKNKGNKAASGDARPLHVKRLVSFFALLCWLFLFVLTRGN